MENPALDQKDIKTRIMNRFNDNKIFIALVTFICVAVIVGLMNTRDSSMIHEFRIDRMEADIKEIKKDVKQLLGRASIDIEVLD